MYEEYFSKVYLNNSLEDYLIALGIFLGTVVFIFIFKTIILRRLQKGAELTETTFDDLIVRIIRKGVVPALYFGALYIAIKSLTINKALVKILDVLGVAVISIIGILTLVEVLQWVVETYWIKKDEDESRQRSFKGIILVMKVLLWSGGILFLLDNLGFEVSTVIAGMGIGGVAIALASQAILGDLFNYFTILFDRPFEVGDFIVVDNHLGTIERIGVKSTRVKTLRGEELVLSNTDLTNSRIQNFKKMEHRRIVFQLGVTYQTKYDQLQEIPKIIKEVIEGIDQTSFDRSHFASYGDFSLNFETAYYITTNDYAVYMDIQQRINLELYRIFEEKGIEFAYPTQTLFLNKKNEAESSPNP